jgi:hypothetical protein
LKTGIRVARAEDYQAGEEIKRGGRYRRGPRLRSRNHERSAGNWKDDETKERAHRASKR